MLEACAEADEDALGVEATVPEVVVAEVVALTEEELTVGVPDAAMEAEDCLMTCQCLDQVDRDSLQRLCLAVKR